MHNFPTIFLYGLCDTYKRFFNCFSKNVYPLISIVVSIAIHPLWCHLFVNVYGLELKGIAISAFITNLTALIMMRKFLYMEVDLKQSVIKFDARAYYPDKLIEYIKFTIPLIIIDGVDFWAWESMTIISGMLSVHT